MIDRTGIEYAAAYGRVSTDSEDQENSFENQVMYFEPAIKSAGLKFYKMYGDKGFSGVYWKQRDEFNKMLKDAGLDVVTTYDYRLKKNRVDYYVSNRKPKFQEIWIKNSSRFARNALSFEVIKLLREKKVYIYFQSQGIYTKDESQDFLLQMFLNIDENESRMKSKAVKWGYERGKEKGKVYTHPKITGYNYIKEENRLVKNKDAATVKLIYDLYTEQNMGVRRIINELERRGIKSPNGNKRWGNTTIKNILNQEKYAGKNNPLRLNHGTFGNKTWAHVKDNYDLFDTDKIEAIITWEQYQKAQKIKSERVVTLNNQTKGRNMSYSRYSKKLICQCCGSNYIRNSDWKDTKKTKKYYFFLCSKKKKLGIGCCDNVNVMEEDLDNIIKNMTYGSINQELLKRKDNYQYYLLKVAIFELDDIDHNNDNKAKEIYNKIEEKKKQLETYFKRWSENPELDKFGVFAKMIEDLNKEIEELSNEYEKISSINKELYDDIYEMYHESIKIRDMELSFKKRYSESEILDMIDNIYVSKLIKTDKKADLRFTYVIFKRSKELLDKYKYKYKLNIQDLEGGIVTENVKEEIKTYYKRLEQLLERDYISK